jgi:5-methyltetrahydrofolate--homocysteine methyltransferase
LMSTSMPMTKELIEYLTATGIRHEYKIMVGGAPVTEEYAKEIGADGYGRDANKAVGVARELLASRGQQP